MHLVESIGFVEVGVGVGVGDGFVVELVNGQDLYFVIVVIEVWVVVWAVVVPGHEVQTTVETLVTVVGGQKETAVPTRFTFPGPGSVVISGHGRLCAIVMVDSAV